MSKKPNCEKARRWWAGNKVNIRPEESCSFTPESMYPQLPLRRQGGSVELIKGD